jgi:RHS repeat-associated protein
VICSASRDDRVSPSGVRVIVPETSLPVPDQLQTLFNPAERQPPERRSYSGSFGFLSVLPLVVGLLFANVASAQETVEYYGTDAVGSTRTVFDQSGAVVARTDYLPFGEEVFAPGALPKERFTGQERDGDAGLDYFHFRMDVTRTGRFSTTDPADGSPQNPNLGIDLPTGGTTRSPTRIRPVR